MKNGEEVYLDTASLPEHRRAVTGLEHETISNEDVQEGREMLKTFLCQTKLLGGLELLL